MGRLLRASIGAFLLMVGAMAFAFLLTATDSDLYFRIQKAEAVEAGVPDDVLLEYDGKMAGFLKGQNGAFDDAPLFNEREIAHMRDVQSIFDALRAVREGALIVGLALIAECVLRNADWRRMILRACLYGGALLALHLIAILIWALIDFHGAFVVMHRALFSNNLWRLDPDTDLMIRMLPERFFVHFAGVLALRCLLAALIVPAAAFVIPRIDRSRTAWVHGFNSFNQEDDHDLIRLSRKRKR